MMMMNICHLADALDERDVQYLGSAYGQGMSILEGLQGPGEILGQDSYSARTQVLLILHSGALRETERTTSQPQIEDEVV